MPNDQIRYDVLVQEALRGMVRSVLAQVAQTKALPGEHHFFITFDTGAVGVVLSPRLRAQYPEEMTIVLQHQFWDLKVAEDAFEVGLSFGGVAERLKVPLDAIKKFTDPSVQFTLQFETLMEGDEEDESEPSPAEAAKEALPKKDSTPMVAPAPAEAPAAERKKEKKDKADDAGGAEVVRLDRFRKK